jgi:hypothetical protein
MENMHGAVYPPPRSGLPYLAVIFHSDGSVAMTRPFVSPEEAHSYVMDIASSLVTVDPPQTA